MRPQKKVNCSGAATGASAMGGTQGATEHPSAGVWGGSTGGLGTAKAPRGGPKGVQQGRTSWRGRAQLRMTLFTSRDGWDSSVGWL